MSDFKLRELEEREENELDEQEQEELLKFAIDRSILAIDGQIATLASLRQRAMNIIAINGAILLLARTVIPDTGIQPQQPNQPLKDWVLSQPYVSGSVAMFSTSVVLSLMVLATRRGWLFSISGKRVADRYLVRGWYANIRQVYSDLIEISDKNYKSNERKLSRMHWLLLSAICATVLHGSLWLIGGFIG